MNPASRAIGNPNPAAKTQIAVNKINKKDDNNKLDSLSSKK